MMTHLTRWKTARLTVLALLPPLLSHICTNKDQIQPYLLKSRLYVNYIITGACWARLFCSSGMKRSPITPDSKKNMGSVAELRIKSILWSNLRRCSSNKAESNGKIKSAQCLDSPTLLIWPPEWSVILSWQKLGEREWMRRRQVTLSLSSSSSEFARRRSPGPTGKPRRS